jgi:hypothetical protein
MFFQKSVKHGVFVNRHVPVLCWKYVPVSVTVDVSERDRERGVCISSAAWPACQIASSLNPTADETDTLYRTPRIIYLSMCICSTLSVEPARLRM